MDILLLKDNETEINENLFNSIEVNFNTHLEAFNSSEFGIVRSGLDLNFEDRILKVALGSGYSPSGKLLTLSEDREFDINLNSLSYIVLADNKLEVRELNVMNFDPYKAEIFKEKDILIIGFYHDLKVHKLNRSYQIPNFPVNGISFWNGEFINYVTLRGCKIATEYFEHFLRVGNGYELGGNSKVLLTKENIPSLNLEGITSLDGSHRHTFTIRGDKDGHGSNGGGSNFWKGTGRALTSTNGRHSHTMTLNHENQKQSELSLEPDFTTFLPIIREY